MSIKHGKSGTRLYIIWKTMKKRCNNSHDKDYKNYGKKGISVCEEWNNDYQSFYDWAIQSGYSDKLTIDRIDVNKGYNPTNCRWTTMKVQSNNRSNNCLVTYNGKTQTLAQWSEETGIKYQRLYDRLHKCHWTVEKAFNTP